MYGGVSVWAVFCCIGIPVDGRVSIVWEGFCGMGVSAVWGDFYGFWEGAKWYSEACQPGFGVCKL